jgi:hypothetical protein
MLQDDGAEVRKVPASNTCRDLPAGGRPDFAAEVSHQRDLNGSERDLNGSERDLNGSERDLNASERDADSLTKIRRRLGMETSANAKTANSALGKSTHDDKHVALQQEKKPARLGHTSASTRIKYADKDEQGGVHTAVVHGVPVDFLRAETTVSAVTVTSSSSATCVSAEGRAQSNKMNIGQNMMASQIEDDSRGGDESNFDDATMHSTDVTCASEDEFGGEIFAGSRQHGRCYDGGTRTDAHTRVAGKKEYRECYDHDTDAYEGQNNDVVDGQDTADSLSRKRNVNVRVDTDSDSESADITLQQQQHTIMIFAGKSHEKHLADACDSITGGKGVGRRGGQTEQASPRHSTSSDRGTPNSASPLSVCTLCLSCAFT